MSGSAEFLFEFKHSFYETFLHQTKPIFLTPILSTNMASQNKYPFLPFCEERHGAIKKLGHKMVQLKKQKNMGT
jgi:hypothetical protein